MRMSALALLALVPGIAVCEGPAADDGEPGSPRSEAPGPASSVQAEVTLAVGDSATFDGMTVRLLGIRSDSRCPIDVTCVWEGTVEAEIRVRTAAGVTDTVIDLVRSNPISLAPERALRLVTVAPGPGPAEAREPAGPYRLTFRLDREGPTPR